VKVWPKHDLQKYKNKEQAWTAIRNSGQIIFWTAMRNSGQIIFLWVSKDAKATQLQ